MNHSWLLEKDSDNEVITAGSEVDSALIEDHLDSFDGQHTFYTALFHDPDEACIWCIGEPDARLLEVRLVNPRYKHVILKSSEAEHENRIPVRVGSHGETVLVQPEDLFNREQTLEIFLFFFERRVLPPELLYKEEIRLFS